MFTNENRQKIAVDIRYDKNGSKSGFSIQNKDFDFIVAQYKEIIDIHYNEYSICDITYNDERELETNSSYNAISSELLKIILLTVPYSEGLVTLDYESGYEYSPHSVESRQIRTMMPDIDKYPLSQAITPFSTEYLRVYLYQPTSVSLNPFGHLDIQIGSQIHSYADYASGNYLIASNVSAYQNYQRNKYSITSCTITVPPAQKANVLRFFTSQNKSLKTHTPEFSSGAIYKINSGKYKTYILPTINCSTFVLDGLRTIFNNEINFLCHTYNTTNTPKSIFRVCQELVWK